MFRTNVQQIWTARRVKILTFLRYCRVKFRAHFQHRCGEVRALIHELSQTESVVFRAQIQHRLAISRAH